MLSRTAAPRLLAGAAALALLLTACGDAEEETTGPTPTSRATTGWEEPLRGTPTRPTTDGEPTPMPTVRNAPDPADGLSEESARAHAMRFLEQWAVFSPAPYQGKDFWFSSWEGQATPEFRAQMRRDADSLWEWTWQQRRKACCVEFPDPATAELGRDGETAVVQVPLRRVHFPLDGNAGAIEDDLVEENKLYVVELVAKRDGWLVDVVKELPVDQGNEDGGR